MQQTQMYTVGGGGHPCRLMKLIISHQSSSMRKSDDEEAETHMLQQLYSEENDTTKYDAVRGHQHLITI